MKLALKELTFSKKKYLLIELIIVLLMFMVLFLSGMANGLARAISSGIEEMKAEYFLINDSSEDLITLSSLDEDVLEQVKSQTSDKVAPLDIQRMYLQGDGADEKLNVTYFAIEAGSFLEPDLMEGTSLADADVKDPIILDDDFQVEGIKLGDVVADSSTGIKFTVVGFSKNQMYGHTSVGFITTDNYTAIRKNLNPTYEVSYHAIAIAGNDIDNINIAGTKIDDKATIIENLPAYMAEKLTITMIVWVLVLVTAVIIGVFYYIMTMQKEKEYAVMKSLGVEMGQIAGIIISQVGIVAVTGAIVANVLNYAMSAALPQTMPYFLRGQSAFLVSIAFIAISILSSLLSVIKVSKVDPMTVIGGAQ